MNLRAQIILVLLAVILPTFLIVTIAENKFTLPVLEEEIRQVGVHSGKSLAAEIVSSRMLSLPSPTPAVENAIQEVLQAQPDITRIDVMVRDPVTGGAKLLATSAEDEPIGLGSLGRAPFPLVDAVTSEYRAKEDGTGGVWEILVPIEQKARDARGPKRYLGTVRVSVTTQVLGRLARGVWKITAVAAVFSVITLVLALSTFLRKTFSNDRLLQLAQSENSKLLEQLHEANRQLFTTEKLAVMGQLTASFAHEIGTPLNAVGGHLHLLKEELGAELGAALQLNRLEPRFEIMETQLKKIEDIVKGFLQSTALPPSQKQLVDLNKLLLKSLEIVQPRVEALGVEVTQKLCRTLAPVRAVPLDFEQIFLNLISNALDSLQAKGVKQEKRRGEKRSLEIATELMMLHGSPWAQVSIFDSGEGIAKSDLQNIFRPFFTTKKPGEGTGLGLTICNQLTHKYGGEMVVDSKEGAWAQVVVRIPYQATA